VDISLEAILWHHSLLQRLKASGMFFQIYILIGNNENGLPGFLTFRDMEAQISKCKKENKMSQKPTKLDKMHFTTKFITWQKLMSLDSARKPQRLQKSEISKRQILVTLIPNI